MSKLTISRTVTLVEAKTENLSIEVEIPHCCEDRSFMYYIRHFEAGEVPAMPGDQYKVLQLLKGWGTVKAVTAYTQSHSEAVELIGKCTPINLADFSVHLAGAMDAINNTLRLERHELQGLTAMDLDDQLDTGHD